MKQEYHIFKSYLSQVDKECADGNKDAPLTRHQIRLLLSEGARHVRNLIALREDEMYVRSVMLDDLKNLKEEVNRLNKLLDLDEQG